MPTSKEIADKIKTAIDDYAIAVYDDGHRTHLGASVIGNDCARSIYFTFRWIKKQETTGRQQRLFQRGHLEEGRFADYLRGVGFKVRLFDPDYELALVQGEYKIIGPNSVDDEPWNYVTDNPDHIRAAQLQGIKLPQLRISDCGDHFGGSLDALLEFPADWNIPGVFLGEFKTKGTGAGFTKLGKEGVAIAAPEHWAQMCCYGYKRGIEYGIYFSVNKNDDDLHVEIVKLDHGLGADMVRKAAMIIAAEKPPAKISETITNFKCKWCNFKEQCHEGAPIEKNCRSCFNSVAIDGAKWACKKWNAVIPDEAIKVGCDQWLGVI